MSCQVQKPEKIQVFPGFTLIHALLQQQLAHNEVRDLAEQGNELVRILRSQSGAMNRAIEKQKNP